LPHYIKLCMLNFYECGNDKVNKWILKNLYLLKNLCPCMKSIFFISMHAIPHILNPVRTFTLTYVSELSSD